MAEKPTGARPKPSVPTSSHPPVKTKAGKNRGTAGKHTSMPSSVPKSSRY